MTRRRCSAMTTAGRPCAATPLLDEPFCLWHSVLHAQDAADARRLGGLRRRREKAVAGAYELNGLDTPEGLRRVLEISALDTLSLDNSVARSRTLIAVVVAGARLLETGELDVRITALEAAHRSQTHESPEPLLDKPKPASSEPDR